jgi:hypothetical protein
VYIETGVSNWSFFDVVWPAMNRARLEAVLSKTPHGRDLIQQHLRTGEAGLSVMSTLFSKITPYRFIAYAWDHTVREGGDKKKLSLHDFVHGEPSILVLGNSTIARPTVRAFNQLLMKRLGEIILALPDSQTRRIWFFIDEARMAGKFDGLTDLVVMGRSKGVCPVLGFQDLDGFLHVYGEKEGMELLGQFANRCILGLRSQRTAEWAEKLLGVYEGFERHDSRTLAGENVSTTTGHQLVKRETVLTSQFDLPQTGPKHGLTGYYLIPEIDAAFRYTFPWSFIEKEIISFGMPKEGEVRVPDFEPRPVSHQYPRPWTQEDLVRLGIKINPEEEQKADSELNDYMDKQEGILPELRRPSDDDDDLPYPPPDIDQEQ